MNIRKLKLAVAAIEARVAALEVAHEDEPGEDSAPAKVAPETAPDLPRGSEPQAIEKTTGSRRSRPSSPRRSR